MWQTIRAPFLKRHVHAKPYAALLLSGAYEEAGDLGRFQVQVSPVIFHDRFEAHLDRIPKAGAVLLNLHLPEAAPISQELRACPPPTRLCVPQRGVKMMR